MPSSNRVEVCNVCHRPDCEHFDAVTRKARELDAIRNRVPCDRCGGQGCADCGQSRDEDGHVTSHRVRRRIGFWIVRFGGWVAGGRITNITVDRGDS